MAVFRIDAVVTSPGVINSAMVHLENIAVLMAGSDTEKSASLDVEVVGDLDVFFFINAFFGTDWQLTITVNGVDKKPVMSGTTDTKNRDMAFKSYPVP